MDEIPGLAARRAALRMGDAVLRRGETLERAAHGATQGMRDAADRALALAIAAEALRWLADLDALIDSASCSTAWLGISCDSSTRRGTGLSS